MFAVAPIVTVLIDRRGTWNPFGNGVGAGIGRLAWIRRSAAEETLERDWRKRRQIVPIRVDLSAS
jgi:hypothetical protein